MLYHSSIQISYFAAGIIAHLACIDEAVWQQRLESTITKEECVRMLGVAVCSWYPPNSEMVAYRSFRPFESLILHHDSRLEIQLWAVWAIHHILTRKKSKYVPVLRDCMSLRSYLNYLVSVDETTLCLNSNEQKRRPNSTSSRPNSPFVLTNNTPSSSSPHLHGDNHSHQLEASHVTRMLSTCSATGAPLEASDAQHMKPATSTSDHTTTPLPASGMGDHGTTAFNGISRTLSTPQSSHMDDDNAMPAATSSSNEDSNGSSRAGLSSSVVTTPDSVGPPVLHDALSHEASPSSQAAFSPGEGSLFLGSAHPSAEHVAGVAQGIVASTGPDEAQLACARFLRQLAQEILDCEAEMDRQQSKALAPTSDSMALMDSS